MCERLRILVAVSTLCHLPSRPLPDLRAELRIAKFDDPVAGKTQDVGRGRVVDAHQSQDVGCGRVFEAHQSSTLAFDVEVSTAPYKYPSFCSLSPIMNASCKTISRSHNDQSTGRIPAIDHQERAGDERGFVRCQEQNRKGDLTRIGNPLQQMSTTPFRIGISCFAIHPFFGR